MTIKAFKCIVREHKGDAGSSLWVERRYSDRIQQSPVVSQALQHKQTAEKEQGRDTDTHAF